MKKLLNKTVLIAVLIVCSLLTGCAGDLSNEASMPEIEKELFVHYIDVGQGDSILIQFPEDKVALIDGGTREAGEKVVGYIKSLGLKRLDYLIATHPHEDHIGGLPEVIRNFEIGKIYMPNKTANTKIFEELLTEIENKGLKITIVEGFKTIIDDENLKFVTLGPLKDSYSNTNDFSIVTKIEYGENSFLFTGDIEREAEMDLVEEGLEIKANVLKVAHHGSNTSSTIEFLEEVEPDYSVISLGKDNPYGHPHKEVMDRLNAIGTKILRTDELGDIVIKANGKDITIENVDMIEANKQEDIIYIGNKNTKIVHSEDCTSLPRKENQQVFYSLKEALDLGYKPHSRCIK